MEIKSNIENTNDLYFAYNLFKTVRSLNDPAFTVVILFLIIFLCHHRKMVRVKVTREEPNSVIRTILEETAGQRKSSFRLWSSDSR